MGDNNSIRQGASYTGWGQIYVRQGVSWNAVNRSWVREGPEWKLYMTSDQPPKLTCLDQNICQAGGNPDCDTLSGCVNSGEQHRVEWDYSGSKDGHHLALHVSVNGGGYVETGDNIALDNGEADADCCEFVKSGYCSGDNSYLLQKNNSSDLGSCTTTYQYRGRVELDGTDTLVGSALTHGSAGTGCDTACTA